MRTRGARGRRGFAIAFVALCLTAVAPLAAPAAAASPPPPKAAKVYGAKPKPKVGPRVRARQRALAARQRKAKKLAAQRRAALRAKALRAKALRTKAGKHKPVPLSLPQLALIAIAPFVLMGIYLLGADHMRRRVPRKRRRRASLVITRVSDR